jgi:hypothetical protein
MILSKTHGPTKIKMGLAMRIRTNEEIDFLIKDADIIKYKSTETKMGWAL